MMAKSTPAIPPSRQAQLSRLDWRFLLPGLPENGFEHMALPGGQPWLAERVRESGLARQVSLRLPKGAQWDAVALLDGETLDWSQIAACLKPGGVLYAEVDRRRSGGRLASPSTVTRALHSAGMQVSGVYAVRPSFAASEAYLPLDGSGALRWYINSVYPSGTAAQRLLEWALRVFTGLDGWRFAAVTPFYALTAVKEPASAGWPPVLRGVDGASAYRAALLPGSSRVTLLAFEGEDPAPKRVYKVAKRVEVNNRNRRERQALLEIRRCLDDRLRLAIPEPLGAYCFGAADVSVESALPGVALQRLARKRPHQAQRDLQQAAAWLAEFHCQTLVRRDPWDSGNQTSWLLEPLAAYRAAFGSTSNEERLFEAAREWGETLRGLDFPIVWQHRDFNVWNVYRAGGSLQVLDWEGGQPGPALVDLLHFATHWQDAVLGLHSRDERLQGFQALFLEPEPGNPRAVAVEQALQAYLAKLRLDRRFLPVLMVYLWVELALRRNQQQRDLGEPLDEPRRDNLFVGYVGLLDRHIQALLRLGERGGGS